MNLDERFHSLQRSGAPDLWPDIARRDPGPPEPTGPGNGRRVAIAVLAFAVAAAGFAVAVLALREGSTRGDHPSPSIAAPPVGPVTPEVSAVARIPAARAMVFGAGSLWVAVSDDDGGFAGHVVRLDPGTGAVIADIPTATVPTWEVGGGGIAADDDVVWVVGGVDAGGGLNDPGGGTDAFAVRIDPSTNEVVAEVTLGGAIAADVAVDETGVWVLYDGDDRQDGRMQVARIDPATNEVRETTPLYSGYGHFLFAVGGRVVVVTNASVHGSLDGSELTIIDPSTGDLSTAGAGTALWPAADEGALWGAAADGLVSIDPGTGDVTGTYPVSSTGDALAVGAGGVWFLDPRDRSAVHRFDPATNEVDVDVDLDADISPNVLVASPDALWVLTFPGDLVRVDLR
jgi:hypothetical protein